MVVAPHPHCLCLQCLHHGTGVGCGPDHCPVRGRVALHLDQRHRRDSRRDQPGQLSGGWLADRWASLRLLGIIFLLGGLSAFIILLAEGLGYQLPDSWPMMMQIIILTTALFFLPSAILGAVSPVVAKLAVRDLSRTGRTVGRIYAEATAYMAERQNPSRALFIGGGGYTFPKYMEATYPESELDVVEIDPGVTETAYEQLGLSRDTRIASHNEDARLFLMRLPTNRYTLIMGDAFNDYSMPYHLTTREFNELVHHWLTPGGLYMVNLIDGTRHDFLRAYVHTLQQTFRHVYVAPASEHWRASPRMTFVLIATDEVLELEKFKSATAGGATALTPERVLTEKELQTLLDERQAVLLTDQYAPVDQMLAPVARGE